MKQVSLMSTKEQHLLKIKWVTNALIIEESTHFAFLTGLEYFFLIDLITLEFNQESVELIFLG